MNYFKVTEQPHHTLIGFHVAQSANALSLAAARELSQLQKSLKGSSLPVVFVSDHPSVFCSGGNLSDYKSLKGKAPGLKVNREIARHLDSFQSWPVPKLAVIEGDVLGGGMEWLSRFDFRWSAPSAVFSFWQRRIGLSTGWGGGKFWAEKIGEDRLRRLLIEARLISAAEALSIGVIDRLVISWNLDQEINDWAKRMCDPSVQSVLKWSAKKEASIFSKLWMGPVHRRALERWKA